MNRKVITPVITNPEFYDDPPQGDDPPEKRHDEIPSSVEATTSQPGSFDEVDRLLAAIRYETVGFSEVARRVRDAQR